MSWLFNSLSLLLIMSKEKRKRKNFTCTKKTHQDQVIFKGKFFMKNDPRKAIQFNFLASFS